MQINPINTIHRHYHQNPSCGKVKKEDSPIESISFSDKYLGKYNHFPQLVLYNPKTYAENREETFDSFTGMRDKNCLMCALENAIKKTERTGEEFSVAMFDMDNFKSINELLGYSVGDEFIKAIGSTVDSIAKENNLKAYRFGGEEFVVVFDEQSNETIEKVMGEIFQSIGLNSVMYARNDEYVQKAQAKLDECFEKYNKINNINHLELKREVLKEIMANLVSKEAKCDPYLIQASLEIDEAIKNAHLEILDERIQNETFPEFRVWLFDIRNKIQNDITLTQQEEDDIREYAWSIYDKSFEIHQLKKWLFDFDKNDGFSITGGVVRYSSYGVKDKAPMDLITEVGELLSNGKRIEKGRGYSRV